jgi:hypothetical protein
MGWAGDIGDGGMTGTGGLRRIFRRSTSPGFFRLFVNDHLERTIFNPREDL